MSVTSRLRDMHREMNALDHGRASPHAGAGRLRGLAKSSGDASEFWRGYIEAVVQYCGATRGCVLIRRGELWGTAGRFPLSDNLANELPAEEVDRWAKEGTGDDGVRIHGPPEDSGPATNGISYLVGILKEEAGSGSALVVLEENGTAAPDAMERLALLLEIPDQFEARRLAEAAQRDAARLANALDLMALLNGQTRFQAAAMALCNELAARFKCDRVSLGWLEKNHVEVKAMSHTERIEPKMEAVQQLAAALEEACDQEEEIVWPRPEGQAFITRDHEIYATKQHAARLATLPLFHPHEAQQPEGQAPRPIAAVTLERGQSLFALDELRTLRLILDQAARPLEEMHRMDRWFGARWLSSARHRAASLLGAEHTWWKILALALALALLVLIFGRKEHRVEGTFTLKTDSMAILSAPFEGHIDHVNVRPGDAITKDGKLAELDTREFLLQKQAAIAERERQGADALKAESSGDVAGMRVARAREAQARAQVDLIADRLARAVIRSPFDGVVVEGDLRERIAAPVQKGDTLLKIARLEDLYLVMEVPERDIQYIREGAPGSAAFASLPGERFAFVVERIEPAARSKDHGSFFSVRCRFTSVPADWWRPGMTGIAKVDAGSRSLLWLCTHRTMDFLRLWWW